MNVMAGQHGQRELWCNCDDSLAAGEASISLSGYNVKLIRRDLTPEALNQAFDITSDSERSVHQHLHLENLYSDCVFSEECLD